MKNQTYHKITEIEQGDLPGSPDDTDIAEEDLWFLPGPAEEGEPGPFPRADRRLLISRVPKPGYISCAYQDGFARG